jgi:hypothetical protein
MLDAVEARLSALRFRGGAAAVAAALAPTAVALESELRHAGVSASEFARLTRVPYETLIALLTPSARRKLLDRPAPPVDRNPVHPFSRIEDL